MKTVCAWCPKDAPPMHDDGRDEDTRLNHGICQPHLFAMRAKLFTTEGRADDAVHVRPSDEGVPSDG